MANSVTSTHLPPSHVHLRPFVHLVGDYFFLALVYEISPRKTASPHAEYQLSVRTGYLNFGELLSYIF
jgi:hypothetical protein